MTTPKDTNPQQERTKNIIYNILTTHKTYNPELFPTDEHFVAALIARHIHENFILKDTEARDSRELMSTRKETTI